jgi:hypothetical protein
MELVGSEIEAIDKSESELKASFKDGIISPDELNKGLEEYETKRKELHEQIRREQEQDKRGIQSLIEGQARAIDAAGDNADGNFAMMDYGGTLKSNLKGIENSSRKASRELTMAGVGLKPHSLEQTLFSPRTLKNTGARMSAKLQGVNIGNMQNIAKKNASKANYINNHIDGVMGGLSGALEKGNVNDIQKYSGELTNIQKMVSGKQDIKSLKKSAQMKTNGNKELEGIKKAAKDQIASQKELVGTLIEFYHQLADSGKATPEQIKEMKSLEETMGDLIDAEEESSDKISDSVSGISSGISNIISTITTVIGSIGDVLSTSMGARLFDWFKGSSIGQGINNFVEEKTGITDALNNIPTGVAQEIALNPYKVYDYIGMSNFNPEGYQQEAIKMEQTLEKIHFSVAQTNTKYGLSTDPTYADNLAKYLHSATNGVVDYEDFSNNYAAVGKAGIKENAGQIAEYATLMDKVGAMDSSDVISTLKTLYVNMDLTAEKSVQMVNRIAQAAKTSKVSVSDYAQAVTSIADGYRRIGLDAEDALNVMGNLMDAGYSFKDAQEMASTFGNSLSTFSNNNSDVILSGLMSGQTDPYKMLADAQDVTDPNWGKNMASGMQNILNMKEAMFGKGSSLAKYQMLMTMQNDFGFSQRQSAEMYHKLQNGDIGSLEDLLDEFAEGEGTESLEEINSKLVGEAQNLGTQVGSLNSMMAQFEDKAMNEGVKTIQTLITTLNEKGEDGESFFDKNLNDMQKTLDFNYEKIGEYLGSELGKYTQSNARDVKDLADSVGTIGGLLEKIFPLVAGIAIAVGAKALGGVLKGGYKLIKGGIGKLAGKGVEKGAEEVIEEAVKEEAASAAKNAITKTTEETVTKYTAEEVGQMFGGSEQAAAKILGEKGIFTEGGTYTSEQLGKAFGMSTEEITGAATNAGVTGTVEAEGATAAGAAGGIGVAGAAATAGLAIGAVWGAVDAGREIKRADELGLNKVNAGVGGFLGGSVRDETGQKTWGNALGNAGKYALIGGSIGTFVGGPIGTAVGAGVGAVAGFAMGTRSFDRYIMGNSEESNRIISGIDRLDNKLTDKYMAAGFTEDTAQVMAEGLSQFGDQLGTNDSKTLDAFAAYYAEAISNGQTPAEAVESFKANQNENIQNVIAKMEEMKISLKSDGSIAGADTAELTGEAKMQADATWDKWQAAKNQTVEFNAQAGWFDGMGGSTKLKTGRDATMENIVRALNSESAAKQAGIIGIYNDIEDKSKEAIAVFKDYGGDYDKIVNAATYEDNAQAQLALQYLQDSMNGVGLFNNRKVDMNRSTALKTLNSSDKTIDKIKSGSITDYTKQYVTEGEKQISQDLKDLKDSSVDSQQFSDFWDKYQTNITSTAEYQETLEKYNGDEALAQAEMKEKVADITKNGVGVSNAEELSRLIGVEVGNVINGIDADSNDTETTMSSEQVQANKDFDIWAKYKNAGGIQFTSENGSKTIGVEDIFKSLASGGKEGDAISKSIYKRFLEKNEAGLSIFKDNKYYNEETGDFNTTAFLNAAKVADSDESKSLSYLTNLVFADKAGGTYGNGNFGGLYTDDDGQEVNEMFRANSDIAKNIIDNKSTVYNTTENIDEISETAQKDLYNIISKYVTDKNNNGTNADEIKEILNDNEQLNSLLTNAEDELNNSTAFKDLVQANDGDAQKARNSMISYLKSINAKNFNITVNGSGGGDSDGDYDDDGSGDGDGSPTSATTDFQGNFDKYFTQFINGTTSNAWDKLLKDIGYENGTASLNSPKTVASNMYENASFIGKEISVTNPADVRAISVHKTETNTYDVASSTTTGKYLLSAEARDYFSKSGNEAQKIMVAGQFASVSKDGRSVAFTGKRLSESDITKLNLASKSENVSFQVKQGVKPDSNGTYGLNDLQMIKTTTTTKTSELDTSNSNSKPSSQQFDASKVFDYLTEGHMYSINNYTVSGSGKNSKSTNLRLLVGQDGKYYIGSSTYDNSTGKTTETGKMRLTNKAEVEKILNSGYQTMLAAGKTNLTTLKDLTGDISGKLSEINKTVEDATTSTPAEPESEEDSKGNEAEQETAKNTGEIVDTLNGTGYLGAGQLLFTAQSFGSNSSLSGQSLATTDWEKQTTKITSAGGGLVAPDAQRYSYALANSSVNTYASLNKSLQASATAGNARTTASVNIQIQGILDSVKKAVQDSLEQSGVNVMVQAKESNTYG